MPSNHILLQRINVSSPTSSIIFNGIPQTGYTDLKVVVSARDTSTAGANWNGYSFTILPNGLNTNISQRSLFGNGTNISSYTDSYMYNVISMGMDTTNTFSNVEIYIPNYTSNSFKSFSIDGGAETNFNNSSIRISSGLWSNVLAITSLQLNAYSNFAVGSTFSLYGIAKVGTAPAIAPKAIGGDIITTNGTYWFHAFLSTGTFTPMTNLSCDYLVVGGGGGGTYGGGGAGGLKSSSGNGGGGTYIYSPLSLNRNQSYTATVGAGGSAGTNTSSSGASNGTTSSFSIWTGAGGGRGGIFVAPVSENGQNGGSGGGGGGADSGNTPGAGGQGIVGHGYNGGSGVAINTTNGGGGGGGAMAAGGNAIASSFGGEGGIGKSLSGFATPTGTGSSGYYAGGGSGGGSSSRAGGLGGGGAGGAANSAGSPAVRNTGGGGGGAGNTTGGLAGGAGGSGIVIVSYLV